VDTTAAPFVLNLPVRFADVDHAGIVYYPRYFHLFHLALEEFLRSQLGAQGYRRLLDDEQLGFPTVSAQCDYRAPLRFGDLAEVLMIVAKRGQRSLTLGFRVHRLADDERPRALCAEGSTVCAIVDLAEFHAVPMPDKLAAVFGTLSSSF